jgi:hypothetical protein
MLMADSAPQSQYFGGPNYPQPPKAKNAPRPASLASKGPLATIAGVGKGTANNNKGAMTPMMMAAMMKSMMPGPPGS